MNFLKTQHEHSRRSFTVVKRQPELEDRQILGGF